MTGKSWLLALPLVAATPAFAKPTCADVLARIGPVLADVNCFASDDLTTNNPSTTNPTTPKDNAFTPPLPGGAFTPVTDRATIVLAFPRVPGGPAFPPGPGPSAVRGIQLQARIADDPTGEARFLLRLPENWNGKLVVASPSGTRSEFNGDFAWSDYVLQKGYAYASQNKGVLNLRIAQIGLPTDPRPSDPLACRLNPNSGVWVHFYDNDRDANGKLIKPFTEWQFRVQEAAIIAKEGVKAGYGKFPKRTYAVGTSNGGYQVRRAIEAAPELFDGGVDWEGTFVDASNHNLLATLPVGVREFVTYRDTYDYNRDSPPARAMLAAGYPPDIVVRNASGKVTDSLWKRNWESFWEVTLCQWQKNLDPSYDTYVDGTGNYDYAARAKTTRVRQNLKAFATTGEIERPLITVAGTMDALLPIQHHARVYASRVASENEGGDENEARYRLYEVQNGTHIEQYNALLPGIELIEPHAQKAFDLLVDHVEHRKPLPPSQCIARGGSISSAPAQRGSCKQLFAP